MGLSIRQADRWPRLLQPVVRLAVRVRRWWFMRRFNAAYARLRRDPVAWAEELEERRLFENTLMDGLEDEPPREDEGSASGAPQSVL